MITTKSRRFLGGPDLPRDRIDDPANTERSVPATPFISRKFYHTASEIARGKLEKGGKITEGCKEWRRLRDVVRCPPGAERKIWVSGAPNVGKILVQYPKNYPSPRKSRLSLDKSTKKYYSLIGAQKAERRKRPSDSGNDSRRTFQERQAQPDGAVCGGERNHPAPCRIELEHPGAGGKKLDRTGKRWYNATNTPQKGKSKKEKQRKIQPEKTAKVSPQLRTDHPLLRIGA